MFAYTEIPVTIYLVYVELYVLVMIKPIKKVEICFTVMIYAQNILVLKITYL